MPAVEKTVPMVTPSAPSPRRLSRSWAWLTSQGTHMAHSPAQPLSSIHIPGKDRTESIRVLGMGKQSWGLEVLGRASARRLRIRREEDLYTRKGELREWGTRLFVDAPTPNSHSTSSPNPPHILPLGSTILDLDTWGIVTYCQGRTLS